MKPREWGELWVPLGRVESIVGFVKLTPPPVNDINGPRSLVGECFTKLSTPLGNAVLRREREREREDHFEMGTHPKSLAIVVSAFLHRIQRDSRR